ncbi:MAG: mercuric reductase [Aphanocapsa sp. GSE-SYN-MK-11-07L]|jgi:pyruvate/2-oxoglutarate dehydrogenase complex dihydrolipoamide dehydrogenase (E3) component|nr:mercuric reductase [Aphanocapsa sp. GSE-SYN-MK-11-07L]
MTANNPVTVFPPDEYNKALVAHVHPPDWVNPQPVDCYDLVVLGGGTAGLVAAGGAASLGIGLKVALVESHLLGGDCLNFGCVPSKTLLRSGRAVADVRAAVNFGVELPPGIEINFSAVMERLRRVRATISHHDSAQRFSQEFGVDVFLGKGQFTDNQTISAEGVPLRFKKAVIATGARAAQLQIPGLSEVGYLTNETVFSLTERPQRLAVIGAGPVGCELAQAFNDLGSQVILLHKNSHILDREDADAAEILQQTLLTEGIRLILGCQLERVEKIDGGKVLHLRCNGNLEFVIVDEILLAAGRSPNVENLNLAAVGVAWDQRGVKVNDYLQTSNPKIFAAGDICMDWKFTHAADAAARIVIRNALFAPFGLGRSKLSQLVMPWTTYTHPEIAHVGLYERSAQAQGIAVETIMIPFNDLDRAIADGEEVGFVKIHHRRGSDQIVGATIVAKHAGEMISELTVAIAHKIGLNKLAQVIHPYPTQAEAIKQAADIYQRKSFANPWTQTLLKLLNKLT